MSIFGVILLMNKNKTNADVNSTFLAEVTAYNAIQYLNGNRM